MWREGQLIEGGTKGMNVRHAAKQRLTGKERKKEVRWRKGLARSVKTAKRLSSSTMSSKG